MRRDRSGFFLGLLLLVFFLVLGKLFLVRLERGDVYPAYSSLRADPLGTKILYDSLFDIDDIDDIVAVDERDDLDERDKRNVPSVSRSYTAPWKFSGGRDTALLILGTRPERFMPEAVMQGFENFIGSGGRLVIAFAPVNTYNWTSSDTTSRIFDSDTVDVDDDADTDTAIDTAIDTSSRRSLVNVAERWQVGWATTSLDWESAPMIAWRAADAPLDLPDTMTCFSGLYFSDPSRMGNPSPEWTVLYRRDTMAVLIERRIGRGSLVLTTQPFFFSNEAMQRERLPRLLTWILGGKSNIIFDEYHFGISESTGVMALLRRHGLEELIAGLIVLAFLFIWKNRYRLEPGLPSSAATPELSARGNIEGLANLLRRSIPDREILDVCLKEVGAQRVFAGATLEERYNQICKSLAQERKGKK